VGSVEICGRDVNKSKPVSFWLLLAKLVAYIESDGFVASSVLAV
jgi:hypothetical protein